MSKYEAIVIGTSAGGLEALKYILKHLDKPCELPIIIVQHVSPYHESYLASILSSTGHRVYEVENRQLIESGYVYVAPPNYHVLIEQDYHFTLSVDKRVSFARPSIDVTFETAADAYKSSLIGIVLTGANHDGADGIMEIKRRGGHCIVQDPLDAYASEMPKYALISIEPDYVGDLQAISQYLNHLLKGSNND
jgi:two-component system chemotaxis response regulator CheB